MKVLTAAEMREVDRRTIELGIPGIVLMENAGASRGGVDGASASRRSRRSGSSVLCGKGNNGGDGLAIARQLLHAIPSGGARRGAARARPRS